MATNRLHLVSRVQLYSCFLAWSLSFFLSSGQSQLEEELIASRSELANYKSELSKQCEKVALLQYQVEQLLTKHAEEISTQETTVGQLNIELEAKANLIALLTQQLYQTRVRLKQEMEANAQVCACSHHCVDQKASSYSEGHNDLIGVDHTNTTLTVQSLPTSRPTPKGKQKQPFLTPPPTYSPHPPSTSLAGQSHHIIKRRASTPIRRHLTTPPARTSLPSSSSDQIERRHIHPLRPAHTTKDPQILPSELQQLLTLKEFAPRDAPPVLPPISSTSKKDTDQISIQDQSALGDSQDHSIVGIEYSHAHHNLSSSSPSSSSGAGSSSFHHRRLVLAKSQGLCSAPSTLRVLRYNTRTRQAQDQIVGGGAMAMEEEVGEEEVEVAVEGKEGSAAEGTLLVKENEQTGSGPTLCGTAEGNT